MTNRVRLLPGLSSIAADYDGFILDIWGLIHDGIRLYDGVVDTLRRLDETDKKFVMLTNAPRRSAAVIAAMVSMGMPESYCRDVVSSGEATWRELRDRGHPWYAGVGRRCLHIGPDRDRNLMEGIDLVQVEMVSEADIILNTGPWLDEERVEDYEGLLMAGAERSVPMLCANPDLAVIRGGRRIICAGALAARYEQLGGSVRYLGKPHPSIYDHCFEMLGIADRERILAVGDSLRTDIAGAEAAGLDPLFVIGGIHAEELEMSNGVIPDEDAITKICARDGLNPVAAIPSFVW